MLIISDIVRNIVALVLIFSCLELFLPKGELSRFIRLGFGIILLAMIIIPASEALQNIRFENPFSSSQDTVYMDYQQQSEQITMILQQEAMNEYENEAARQIAATAYLAEGVISASAMVETDREAGHIIRVEISATITAGGEFAQAEDNIRANIAKYFVLGQDIIHIQLREDI